jgi:hypothetical protein
VFSGKDASVALSKMNFNAENFDKGKSWKNDLKPEELVVLNEWIDFFDKRYTLVGYLYDEEIDG